MGLMRNLAGDKQADSYIQEELFLAGIGIVKGEHSGEVPYSIRGELRWWDFERAWGYWIASATDGRGLPLDEATVLHEKEYPIKGKNQPETYGEVVRVMGHAGAPHPREFALPERNTALEHELQELGIDGNVTNGQIIELCNEGKITLPRFVGLYHINTLPGLKEFANVVRKVC